MTKGLSSKCRSSNLLWWLIYLVGLVVDDNVFALLNSLKFLKMFFIRV